MAVTNGTVADITADVTLADSKPDIIANFNDLLENDEDIDIAKADKANPVFTGAVTTPKSTITAEGGIAVKLTNKTGSASVKGSLVATSTTTDNAFMLQANEFDCVGVVYDNGVADGQECLVVVSGIAEVLLKDSTASTRGYWVKCADTDGRADATNPAPQGGSFALVDDHFREIGHCLESKVAGISILCKCVLHQN